MLETPVILSASFLYGTVLTGDLMLAAFVAMVVGPVLCLLVHEDRQARLRFRARRLEQAFGRDGLAMWTQHPGAFLRQPKDNHHGR